MFILIYAVCSVPDSIVEVEGDKLDIVTFIDNDNAVNMIPDSSEIQSTSATNRCETHAIEFDIGDVDFSTKLSDREKFNILANKFVPDKTWKGQKRVKGKNKRRVPSSIFEKSRSALSYSVKKDGVYCAPCCVFATTDELFVRQCHNDWSNIEKHVQRHRKQTLILRCIAL